jgi:hypothetical protein
MENKTAKITRTVFVSDWAGPNGPVYYHEIELSNGDKGQIGSKEKMPSKLNPGSELTYTIEETSRGNKIKAVVTGGNQFQGKGRTMPEPRIQMISFAMSYTKDLIVGGKIDVKELQRMFTIIYNEMISKL